ncbi:rhombotin-1 [Eurytemora carolleeae]|uniref:rhombotin-1 n=1 Tax=Eurytemora carolleeae TaxID=1294199 RepID=UPI000C76F071|nr:rhombotin-1 [Eurytemora carolleeae]|eukprot:XP_023332140.1 rhombotin-1-like [Eurytemora affinis]
MVMRAKTNVYHLECFACQQCGHRFCVGDQYYLVDNRILCLPDYTERMVFASLPSNPSRLAQLKRTADGISKGTGHSNMYGSPLPPSQPGTPLPPISSVKPYSRSQVST